MTLITDGAAGQLMVGAGFGNDPTFEDPKDCIALGSLTTTDVMATGDRVAVWDVDPGTNKGIRFDDFNSRLNHDSLSGFISGEHYNHLAISIVAGAGLSGGGIITQSRTLNLDLSELPTSPTFDEDHYVVVHDASGGWDRRIQRSYIEAGLNHDNLAGFVADEHLDLSALGLQDLVAPNVDRLMFWDDSATAVKYMEVTGTSKGIVGTDLEINAGYVDRGDPAGWDATETALTLDGTWRDLDLSAVVPAGAYAVQIRCFFRSIEHGVGQYGGFRKKGNTNVMTAVSQYTQSNSAMEMQGVLPIDSNGKIQYKAVSTLDIFRVVVKGWLI